MEIKLHNTTKIVQLNGVPARIWEGCTSSGITVHAFITRIAADNSQNLAEFDAELSETSAPSADVAGIPLRLLI